MLYITIASCFCLVAITWCDFKDRSIPLLLLLAEILLVFVFFQTPLSNSGLVQVGLNILLGILHIALVAIWMKLRNKKIKFFKDALGGGDVFLFVIAAFCFPLTHYIWFILVSSILSLFFAIYVKYRDKDTKVLIPLAGIMAALLFVWHIYSWLLLTNNVSYL